MFLLPYAWNWNLAMAFGSILAATDPVAVVALLKSVGASKKLTMQITGESLMNDGTAIVLFTLFMDFYNGRARDAGGIAAFFSQMSMQSWRSVHLALWVSTKKSIILNSDTPTKSLHMVL